MIEITKEPYICSFSKNNVDFHAQTDMLFPSAVVYPSLKLQKNTLPASGETFTFTWINPISNETESISLIAATLYDSLEFGIPSSSSTLLVGFQYSSYVAALLRRIKLFNAWFTVTVIDIDTLVITAKKADENLVITYTSSTTFYFTITKDDDFLNPERREGYEMRALVYFEKDYQSSNFELVFDQECIVADDQTTKIDISEVLDSEIESSWNEYPVPWKETQFFKSKNIRRYYIKFIETWNNEEEIQFVTSDVFVVHWGGVSFDDQQIGDAINLNAGAMNFLTWNPSGKKNTKLQPDWLAWMNLVADSTFTIKKTIETNVTSITSSIQTAYLVKFETIVFDSSYLKNNIEALVPAGQVLKNWSFQIFRGDDAVSPIFRYYLDTSCISKVIAYFNSFGICETFLASGAWSEAMNVSSSIASRSSSFKLNALLPQSFVFDSKHTNSFFAKSSVLTNLEAKRLQSMLNSTIVHVQEANRWTPAIISTSKFPLLTLNEFLSQIEFEILKANENDRASFFELIPEIEIIEDFGIAAIALITNGIAITSFGSLQIFKESTLNTTFTWNAVTKRYENVSPIITPGTYRAVGTVSDGVNSYKINKHFRYDLQKVNLVTYQTGTVAIHLASSNPTASVQIEWGDSQVQTWNYTDVIDDVNHNYTRTGRKNIVLKKPNFKDVVDWTCFDNLGKVPFSRFPNLERIGHFNGIEGNLYLSALSKIKQLYIWDSACTSINIGFQRNITVISLKNLTFSQEVLDEFFIELWTYRKLYAAGSKLVTIENCGGIQSATIISILNGTGEYYGGGLVSDYSWTVTFI